jgi:hypothetical protein
MLYISPETSQIPMSRCICQYNFMLQASVRPLITIEANFSFRLGENPFTMSALQSFLVDRINALDMDGELVKSILMVCHRFPVSTWL